MRAFSLTRPELINVSKGRGQLCTELLAKDSKAQAGAWYQAGADLGRGGYVEVEGMVPPERVAEHMRK